MKIVEMTDVFLNLANFQENTFSTLADPMKIQNGHSWSKFKIVLMKKLEKKFYYFVVFE